MLTEKSHFLLESGHHLEAAGTSWIGFLWGEGAYGNSVWSDEEQNVRAMTEVLSIFLVLLPIKLICSALFPHS